LHHHSFVDNGDISPYNTMNDNVRGLVIFL
jgi:hypothetical protein